MNEIYKDIAGFEDIYEVSNLGNVRNKTTGKLLKQHKVSEYLLVKLYSNGIGKNYLVHRLVAETFIPNPDNKPEVDHVDENKLNNNVDNLRWVNHQENIDHSLSKPVNQYTLDGRLLNTYKSTHEVERKTGINKSSICQCCLGKRLSAGGFIWKFV